MSENFLKIQRNINTGKFTTDKPTYVVYNFHQEYNDGKFDEKYVIKEFKPEELTWYISRSLNFAPYVEVMDENGEARIIEYVDKDGNDNNFKVFNDKDAAVKCCDALNEEYLDWSKNVDYQNARNKLIDAITHYSSIIYKDSRELSEIDYNNLIKKVEELLKEEL